MLQRYHNDQIYYNYITSVPFESFTFVIYYAEIISEFIPVFEHKSNLYSLYYGLDGVVDIISDQQHYTLDPNSLIIVGRNRLHRLAYKAGTNARYFVLLFDFIPSKDDNISYESLVERKEIMSGLSSWDDENFIHIMGISSLREIVEKITEETAKREIGWASQAAQLYYRFVLYALREISGHKKSRVEEPLGYQNIALEATKYIHANYKTSSLSLETVAQTLNVTPRHLNRLFQKMFGCSFSYTVKVIRMNYAKVLLYQSDDSLENIAHEVGLASAAALKKMFLEEEGVSPNEWRIRQQ